jgi:FecR protein
MLYGRAIAFWALAAVTLLTRPCVAQSVISTHSGVVHYFEGAVYLGDQPLQSHPGKFPAMTKGAELRTEQGRAEVLLTPGVFVRIGERSAIRMVDNDLSHTRVELLTGSAIVNSAEPTSATPVTLSYRDWSVRVLEQGVYRLDSDPPHLWVPQGSAEVSAGAQGSSLLVETGMDLPFAAVLVPEQTVTQPRDALSAWAEGRQQSISADNAIAANIQDPAAIDGAGPVSGGFTYFPMLGLPPMGTDLSSAYNSLGWSQPGFNSLYLPGYTFLPLLLGLRSGGLLSSGFPPNRLPLHPRPTPILPVYPHPNPIRPYPTPTAARPAPPVGIHGGIHR